MRKLIAYAVMLVATVLTFSSCLSDDTTEYTYYSDTAITAFTLGTVNRYLVEKASDGVTDSTVKTTVTGSNYKFVIDQAKAMIYNPDSLPYGCDAEHILATISTKNSGYIYLKSTTSDSLSYYSSSDSLDLSQPRTMRVLSQNAENYRDYTVWVNVHKEMEGEFQWNKVDSTSIDLTSATDMKAVAVGTDLFLLASQSGTTSIYAYNGTGWTACTPNFNTPLTTDAYRSALAYDGYIYIVNNGTVLRSKNGNEWQQMSTATGIKQLVATSTTELYGLTASGIVVSTDGGQTWTAETLDSDASLLPETTVGYTCNALKTNNQVERVTFVGTTTSSYANAWSKLVDFSGSTTSPKWTYVDPSGDTNYALANLDGLTVLPYNGYMLAFGKSDNTLTAVYLSMDGGITWKKTTDYTLPDTTTGGAFTAAVDSSHYIWLVTKNGQLWRGRLNDLGWKVKSEE